MIRRFRKVQEAAAAVVAGRGCRRHLRRRHPRSCEQMKIRAYANARNARPTSCRRRRCPPSVRRSQFARTFKRHNSLERTPSSATAAARCVGEPPTNVQSPSLRSLFARQCLPPKTIMAFVCKTVGDVLTCDESRVFSPLETKTASARRALAASLFVNAPTNPRRQENSPRVCARCAPSIGRVSATTLCCPRSIFFHSRERAHTHVTCFHCCVSIGLTKAWAGNDKAARCSFSAGLALLNARSFSPKEKEKTKNASKNR